MRWVLDVCHVLSSWRHKAGREKEKAKKCDLCIDRGRSPRCVEACPKKVLEFVEVDGDRRPIAENNVGAIHELPLLDSVSSTE